MTHLKRQSVPKRWPVARKGTPFVVKPNFNQERGIPLLIALRDMLKLCQNRKEAKRAIYEKKIFVNSKEAKDEKNTLTLFDTIGILSAKKYYKVILTKKGKYSLEEITEKESAFKISRIIKKKTLNGKKIQINFRDGKNFISDMKCSIGDSGLINMKDKKIEKCLQLREKAKVIIVEGKHSGKVGAIEKIKSERKMVKINFGKDEDINVLIKQIMVIE